MTLAVTQDAVYGPRGSWTYAEQSGRQPQNRIL